MTEMSLSEIVRMAAEVGATTAIEQYEKEKRQQQKKKHDWRLRNTKLLLKNYRTFLMHCDDIKLQIEKLDAEILADLDSTDFAVESIKHSKQKTLVIVNFIQQMMWVYRYSCEKSGDEDELRRYRTVEMMYIAEEKLPPREIAERQKIDLRTVYKDVDKACESLSALMFGVDGVRLID